MDLDEVLSELGHFGKFQAFNYVLLSIAILFTGLFEAGFIFTAGDLEYRCYIPECDASETSYQPIWLRRAVPYQHGVPSRCHRFEPNVTNYTYNSSDFCSLEQFDREEIVKCYQWVYDGPESTILREWNITCDENRWKLTLVGTVNNIGQFIGLPIAGFISDAIGRKTTLVVSMVLSCLLGLARSWAWNYEVFLFLEFLEPALGTGVYTSAFILGMELVGPRARVLAATFISSSYALGEALMGAIAWWLQDWRLILRTAYLPAFLCISYYWIVPESVRWLLTKGKNKQAGDIILAAAKTNGVTLSEDVLCRIKSFSQPPEGENAEDSRKPRQGTLLQVFKSKILLVRVIISAFSWVSIVFVYFGLTINSVLVGGNKYTNFILVSLIEFPAYVVTYYAMDRFGRKASLCASLVLSGATCTSFAFVPKDMDWVRLLLFLGGKFAITIAYTVVYVFTAEIFPTELRHSLLGMCATFSQIGSIVSPQTPLLEAYMESLPLLLFGIMSVVSGFLALFFPETLNMKLPDTIEEAQNIGIKETSTSAETTST